MPGLNELLVENKQAGEDIPYKEIATEAAKMGAKDADVLLEGFRSLQKALSDISSSQKSKFRP